MPFDKSKDLLSSFKSDKGCRNYKSTPITDFINFSIVINVDVVIRLSQTSRAELV